MFREVTGRKKIFSSCLFGEIGGLDDPCGVKNMNCEIVHVALSQEDPAALLVPSALELPCPKPAWVPMCSYSFCRNYQC